MPDFDLLILDCDGVLVDSELLASRTGSDCLATCGIDLPAVEIRHRYTGVSFPTWTADVQQRYGVRLPDDFADVFAARLRQRFELELQPVPGIVELLDTLPQRRCVASGSSPERLQHSLTLTGLHGRLAPHIYSVAHVSRGKPAPDLFLHAAAQMGVQPSACVVVEDSVAGIQAARAAGMRAIGFCGGSHCDAGHAGRLLDSGAHVTCLTAPELGLLLAGAAGPDRQQSLPVRA
jgi:HAD superfamily hydrolase (TIGR01509 family)